MISVSSVSLPGMLSVPGKSGRVSVLSVMRQRYPDSDSPLIVHRLDMATSGLMVIAKTLVAYHHLQQQFASHEISKRYVAVLSKPLSKEVPQEGTISLPLRPTSMTARGRWWMTSMVAKR